MRITVKIVVHLKMTEADFFVGGHWKFFFCQIWCLTIWQLLRFCVSSSSCRLILKQNAWTDVIADDDDDDTDDAGDVKMCKIERLLDRRQWQNMTDPFKQCQRPNTPTPTAATNINVDVNVNADVNKNTVGHTLVVSGLDASNKIQICWIGT